MNVYTQNSWYRGGKTCRFEGFFFSKIKNKIQPIPQIWSIGEHSTSSVSFVRKSHSRSFQFCENFAVNATCIILEEILSQLKRTISTSYLQIFKKEKLFILQIFDRKKSENFDFLRVNVTGAFIIFNELREESIFNRTIIFRK